MNQNDKQVLNRIREVIQYTDTRFTLGWDEGKDTSDWLGITLVDGRVTSLTLARIGPAILKGSIPAAIGDLDALERLDLSNNQLTGEIPASIGDLPQLKYLNLENNQLTGEVPASLDCRKARKLRTLKLHGNELSYSENFQVRCVLCGAPAPAEDEMCEDCL